MTSSSSSSASVTTTHAKRHIWSKGSGKKGCGKRAGSGRLVELLTSALSGCVSRFALPLLVRFINHVTLWLVPVPLERFRVICYFVSNTDCNSHCMEPACELVGTRSTTSSLTRMQRLQALWFRTSSNYFLTDYAYALYLIPVKLRSLAN